MKAFKKILYVGLLIVLTFVLLTGCTNSNQSGSTVDEPDITVEYLQGEYANQLMRDEAEYVFGNITIIEEEDGTVKLEIAEKTFVNGDSGSDEYYIEDKNMTVTTELSSEARCTFLQKGMTLPQIMTAEQFVEAHKKDIEKNGGENNPDYDKTKLYDIYIMNGQAELILARYIP